MSCTFQIDPLDGSPLIDVTVGSAIEMLRIRRYVHASSEAFAKVELAKAFATDIKAIINRPEAQS